MVPAGADLDSGVADLVWAVPVGADLDSGVADLV